jgi:multiple sugar transport system permease protein
MIEQKGSIQSRRFLHSSRLTLEEQDKRLGRRFIAPALAVLVIIIGYPVVHSLTISFMRWRPIEVRHYFIGFKNYWTVLTDPRLLIALRNNIIYGLGGSAGKLVIGMALALLLNRDFKGRGLARAFLMLPWVVPITSVATTWRWMYDDQFGIINVLLSRTGIAGESINFLGDKHLALLSVLLVGIWRGYPLFMVMILAGLQSIPPDLYDVAKVDGANAWGRFVNVTVPSIRGIIAIATILSIIWSFNAFNVIWLITKGGPSGATHILSTLAYEFAFTLMYYDRAATLAVISIAVLAVFLFIFVRVQREDTSK